MKVEKKLEQLLNFRHFVQPKNKLEKGDLHSSWSVQRLPVGLVWIHQFLRWSHRVQTTRHNVIHSIVDTFVRRTTSYIQFRVQLNLNQTQVEERHVQACGWLRYWIQRFDSLCSLFATYRCTPTSTYAVVQLSYASQ